MAEINAKTTVLVPRFFIMYDVGEEALLCRGCTEKKPLKILGEGATPAGNIPVQVQMFVGEHAACVARGRRTRPGRQ